MATSFLPERLTFWNETTSGTPPANAAAWVSNGTSIYFLQGTLDPSSIQQSMLEDERSRENVLDDYPMIQGLKGGGGVPFGFETYFHGSNDTPADGSAITQNALATLLEHCMGGVSLGTSDDVVVGGATSTTAVELTDTVANGNWLGFDDADGNVHLRQVISSSAGGVGQLHQLHRALPFTPADGSLARACIVLYLDEDVLEDSGAGPYTFSWLYEKGRGSQRETIQMAGCKSYVSGLSFGRDEVAKVAFTTMVGSFETPENSPVPTWTADPTGNAGRAIGPNTEVWYQNHGTTTENSINCVSFNLDMGIQSVPVNTVTEATNGMPGVAFYSLAQNPATLEMVVTPHADGYLTDFNNATAKAVQFERQAPAGAAWSVFLPYATHAATPVMADTSSALGQTINLRCHHDPDQSTDIFRSRVQLVLC